MDTLSLAKEERIYSGVKTISLTSDAGKDRRQKGKGEIEDEIVR